MARIKHTPKRQVTGGTKPSKALLTKAAAASFAQQVARPVVGGKSLPTLLATNPNLPKNRQICVTRAVASPPVGTKLPLLNKGGKTYHPGSLARRRRWGVIREIRRMQKSTDHCIKRAPFLRLLREIVNDIFPGYRMQKDTVEALLCASEDYVVHKFELCQESAIHCRRTTVQDKDMRLVTQIRKGADALNKIAEHYKSCCNIECV